MKNEIGTLNNKALLRNVLLSVSANEARGEQVLLTAEQLKFAAEMFFGHNVWQGVENITPREIRAAVAERAARD